jgi:hypothetical protein
MSRATRARLCGLSLMAFTALSFALCPASVPPSDVPQRAGLAVGQHFHRIPGSSEDGPVRVPYHFVRSLNNDKVGALQWWTGARTLCEERTPGRCAGESDEDWRALDAWADFHAPAGARALLLTFASTPRWASARPNEPSPYCDACGFTAEPAPRFLAAYRQMVAATVSRYRDRLTGVECWNEPYFDDAGKPRPSSYFSGSPTALADVCEALYTATKSVSAGTLVFCPQPPTPTGMANVLLARTSQGEPLHRFCDVIGAHTYNAVGADKAGRDYGQLRIADAVRVMRETAARLKLIQPLAITEWGIDNSTFVLAAPRAGTFAAMSPKDRGEMYYQTLAAVADLGIGWIGLYSYDSVFEGIWQGTDPATKRPRYDAVQADYIARAVRDFGKPPPLRQPAPSNGSATCGDPKPQPASGALRP